MRPAGRYPQGVRQTTAFPAGQSRPSVPAREKYSEALDVWQGRVTRDWHFYFKIGGDDFVILSIIPHPK
jgi:hypothetical protein